MVRRDKTRVITRVISVLLLSMFIIYLSSKQIIVFSALVHGYSEKIDTRLFYLTPMIKTMPFNSSFALSRKS